jgi:hypothetical protein
MNNHIYDKILTRRGNTIWCHVYDRISSEIRSQIERQVTTKVQNQMDMVNTQMKTKLIEIYVFNRLI